MGYAQACRCRIRLLACVLLGGATLAERPVSAAAEEEKRQREPVTIRLRFKPGERFRYNLKLTGQALWTPPIRGLDWGQMATDFTFFLRAKTSGTGGGYTFDLVGEGLRSAGQTSKGRIDVAAVRQGSKLKAHGKGSLRVASDRSPLQRPMTLTLGPRGQVRFGTGLLPLAIYMLPQVDHRFWTLLTVAPQKAVAPGDQWEVDFKLPMPGAKDAPLSLKGVWKVEGWKKHGGRDVLAIALAARLDLEDSDVVLKNGDQIHVVAGTYSARGTVLWDVEAGVLRSATAEQKILLRSDRPIRREFRSQSQCSLTLMGSLGTRP